MMEQTAYATAPPVLYELSGVEKSCEGPAERITILKNMDLTVRAGESLAIVGASGSGKSTLLHLLGALDTPTAGKVLFEGKSLPDMTPVEKAHFRNKKLGFVFQFHHLLPEFSTEENVAMQALIAGMNRSKALGLARQALERVGLSDRKDHRVTTLSGGERQRISIARAFLKDAPIILLDEATASLDVENETAIQEALSRLIKDKTVLIIAHRMRTVSSADKIVVLKDGAVAEQGSPAQLLHEGGIFAHMVQLQTESQGWSLVKA